MTTASRRHFLHAGLLGAACACLATGAAFAQAPSPTPGAKYVCPPCGCGSDGKEFDAPGICPEPGCGMALVLKPASPKAAPLKASGPKARDSQGPSLVRGGG